MSSTLRLYRVSARQEAIFGVALVVVLSSTASADIFATLATFTMCPLCTCTSHCPGQLVLTFAQSGSTRSSEKHCPDARDCDAELTPASALTRLRCAQLNRRAVMRRGRNVFDQTDSEINIHPGARNLAPGHAESDDNDTDGILPDATT